MMAKEMKSDKCYCFFEALDACLVLMYFISSQEQMALHF